MGIDICFTARQFYIMNHVLSFPTHSDSFFVERNMRKKLLELQDEFDEFNENIARVLRDYLALVSLGEFRHASHSSSAFNKEFYTNAASRETVYKGGVEYDPDNFLPIIEKTFRNFWWTPGFGGEKWADIAKAAMMYGKVPNTIFIDHCMDLFHNGNSCFDKNIIFHYCSCFIHFLNFKKESKDITKDPHLLTVTSDACTHHSGFVSNIKNTLFKLSYNNDILKKLITRFNFNSMLKEQWDDTLESSIIHWKKQQKLAFNGNWEAKTNNAEENLNRLRIGLPPKKFDVSSETQEIEYYSAEGEKQKKNINIITDKFNTSVFPLSNIDKLEKAKPVPEKNSPLKIGDLVKAVSKSAYPDSWEYFLKDYPDGVFTIGHITEDPSGYLLYGPSGEFLFTIDNLISTETEFKIGDKVKAIHCHAYPDDWEYFEDVFPSYEFTITGKENYGLDTSKIVYSTGSSYFFASDLIKIIDLTVPHKLTTSDNKSVKWTDLTPPKKKGKANAKKKKKKEKEKGGTNYNAIR